MKKTLVFACAVMLVLTAAACKGGGKYAEVEKVMNKYIDATEKFATAMEGVKNANDVVKAIEAYTVVAKEVAPKLKGFETKYPEFKDMENPPAELKPIVDRAQAVAMKMMASMSKIAEYASDPKVQEAQAKMTEAMGDMR